MLPTASKQNAFHRNDVRWVKSKGKLFTVYGVRYVSEYVNPFSGWTIRKEYGNGLASSGWWVIFDQNDQIVDKRDTLTWAKAAYENI